MLQIIRYRLYSFVWRTYIWINLMTNTATVYSWIIFDHTVTVVTTPFRFTSNMNSNECIIRLDKCYGNSFYILYKDCIISIDILTKSTNITWIAIIQLSTFLCLPELFTYFLFFIYIYYEIRYLPQFCRTNLSSHLHEIIHMVEWL